MIKIIKFRVWDREKGMDYSPELNDFEKGMHWFSYLEDNYYEVNYELMQYTGQKDSQDKEIYEGDILSSEKEQTFLVEWGLTGFVLERLGKEWNTKVKYPIYRNTTIIGNKYENPELI